MNKVPIIIPMNNTRTVDCITSSGKTYCEKTNIAKDTLGISIIGVAVWTTIVFYLLFKFVEGEISGWIPASYAFISVILLGLAFIFI